LKLLYIIFAKIDLLWNKEERGLWPGDLGQAQARMAWGNQGGRRRLQAAHPQGGPPLKRPQGRFEGGPPAGRRRVGLGGPG
jgi:hypothetical protein